MKRLRQCANWKDLLEMRVRLREYFEYSGRYKDGWEFGYAYADALHALGAQHERRWVQVKDIGYMLILDGHHLRGRREIDSALQDLHSSPAANEFTSTASLEFYACRYLGISHERARNPDLTTARKLFDRAGVVLQRFPKESADYRALWARLQGNYGNLAFDTGDMPESLELHEQSLAAFQALGDLEHAGIANMNIAKTLVHWDNPLGCDPWPYLSSARSAFSQIDWIEGQGRVHEQMALYFLNLARRKQRAPASESYARQAATEGQTAVGMFKRMQSERLCGRGEALMEEISRFITRTRSTRKGHNKRVEPTGLNGAATRVRRLAGGSRATRSASRAD